MPVPPVEASVNSLRHTGMAIRAPGRPAWLVRGIPERWGAATGARGYFSAVFRHFEVIP